MTRCSGWSRLVASAAGSNSKKKGTCRQVLTQCTAESFLPAPRSPPARHHIWNLPCKGSSSEISVGIEERRNKTEERGIGEGSGRCEDVQSTAHMGIHLTLIQFRVSPSPASVPRIHSSNPARIQKCAQCMRDEREKPQRERRGEEE